MSELDDFIEAQQALDGIIKNLSEKYTNEFEELGLFGKEFIADEGSFGALEDIDFDDRHLLFPEEFLKTGPGSTVPDLWVDDYKIVYDIDVRELSEVLREDLRIIVRLVKEDVFVGDTDKLEKTIVEGFRIEIVDTQSAEGTITGFGYTRTTDAPMLVIEMNPILGPEDNLLVQEGNFLVNSYIEEFYPENRSTRLAVLKGEIPLINTQEGSYEKKIEKLKYHTTENTYIGSKQKADMLKMLEIHKNEEIDLAAEIPDKVQIDRATNLIDIENTPQSAAANIVPDDISSIDKPTGGSLGAAKLNDPLVFDSWIDNYTKTTTSFIDNLPLSTTVKNQFDNLVKGRARNLATPGGVMDAVDAWELGVLGLMVAAVAYKEYDEIPTILTNKAVDMFNSMTAPYNIPPVPKEEYDLDYEFINKVVETGEKFMPTDIIIKKVGEVIEGVGEKGLATGFGYVPTTPEKTDTMETKQKIQPGVQEEKMFEQAKPKKRKPTGGAGARIL